MIEKQKARAAQFDDESDTRVWRPSVRRRGGGVALTSVTTLTPYSGRVCGVWRRRRQVWCVDFGPRGRALRADPCASSVVLPQVTWRGIRAWLWGCVVVWEVVWLCGCVDVTVWLRSFVWFTARSRPVPPPRLIGIIKDSFGLTIDIVGLIEQVDTDGVTRGS